MPAISRAAVLPDEETGPRDKDDKAPDYAAEPGTSNPTVVGVIVASALAAWAWSTGRLPTNEKDQLLLLSLACFGGALAMYSHYFVMCVPKPPRSSMPFGLDPLGPISLGKDGKMSRIANWHELTDGEKTAAINAIKKRNAKRKRKLLEAEQQQQTEKKKSRLRTFFAKVRSWLTNPYSPLWRRLRKVFSRQHKLPKEDA